MTGWGSAQRMHVSSFRLEGRRTDSWEMGFASATYILVATTSSYLYIIYILVGATSLYPHIICIYPAWCNIIVSTYCIYPGLILFSSPYIWSVTWLWFPICQNRCPCHQIYVTWIMKKLFTRFRSMAKWCLQLVIYILLGCSWGPMWKVFGSTDQISTWSG